MTSFTGIQHQLRRGTSTQMAAFTGAIGEWTYDTTFQRIVTHDGMTPGGDATGLATTQTSTQTSTAIAVTTALMLAMSTAARTITMPVAANYPSGQILMVVDGSNVAGTANITINCAGSDGFFASGGGSTGRTVISVNGGHIRAISNQSNRWILFST